MADASQNPPQIRNLYPNDALPESRFTIPAGLGRIGITRLGVTGLLRSAIGCLFADATQLRDPALRGEVAAGDTWKETHATTHEDTRDSNAEPGILIESTLRYRPDRQGHRPAVWIHSHDWTWSRRGVGNRSATDDLTGEATYTGSWVGAHTVFATSQDPAVADRLGFAIGEYLLQFSSVIAANHFIRFEVSRIGQVGTFERPARLFAVPIDLPYEVSYEWRVHPEAPRFQRLRTVVGS